MDVRVALLYLTSSVYLGGWLTSVACELFIIRSLAKVVIDLDRI